MVRVGRVVRVDRQVEAGDELDRLAGKRLRALQRGDQHAVGDEARLDLPEPEQRQLIGIRAVIPREVRGILQHDLNDVVGTCCGSGVSTDRVVLGFGHAGLEAAVEHERGDLGDGHDRCLDGQDLVGDRLELLEELIVCGVDLLLRRIGILEDLIGILMGCDDELIGLGIGVEGTDIHKLAGLDLVLAVRRDLELVHERGYVRIKAGKDALVDEEPVGREGDVTHDRCIEAIGRAVQLPVPELVLLPRKLDGGLHNGLTAGDLDGP